MTFTPGCGNRRVGPRERKGVTIIIIVLSLVILMGFTAFAIDYGRVYAFKAQLQTTADAAAMAGALDVLKGVPLEAPTSAETWAAVNEVEETAGVLQSVEPGTFTDDAGFAALEAWDDPGVNAVRATATYTVNYAFAPVIGRTSRVITAQAIGAIGAQTSAACMKPWAVPMTNILHALGKSGENAETYELLPEDVTFLRENQVPIAFKVASQTSEGTNTDVATGTPISGNFYAVQYGPYRRENGTLYDPGPTSGGNTYRDRIAGACESGGVRVGDWLQVENGNMIGPTSQGTKDLCEVGGGGKDFPCNQEIELPIWNKFDGHKEVQVKYVGKFFVTGYVDDQVRGYLTASVATSGGFSGTPGPIQAVALVR